MWLERFAGHSGPSTGASSPGRSSPVPRRSIQLGPSTLPRRPGLSPRTSSLSVASLYGSTESLPSAARVPNGSGLKHELAGSPAVDVPDPVEVLEGILGPLQREENANGTHVASEKPTELLEEIDFDGLSLEEFARAGPKAVGNGVQRG